MTGRRGGQGALDEEVLQSDAYLESLLAAHARALRPQGGGEIGPRLAPELRAAADLLERILPRFHPSFRFEEALAQRLRAAAGVTGRQSRPEVVAFPLGRLELPDELVATPRARGILLGGAIASGVSLAGAAWLAWRRVRRPD